VLIGQKKSVAIAVRKCLGTAEVVKTGGMAGSRVNRPMIGTNQMVSQQLILRQTRQAKILAKGEEHRAVANIAKRELRGRRDGGG
jgi:hypothetical protein